jgi:hypothetical protein
LWTALACADDKPMSLCEARAAIDANLKTPEGKAWDERMGKEVMEKHPSALRQCKPSAGNDLGSFWILPKPEKDGGVQEVLRYPTTRPGTLRERRSAPGPVLVSAAARLLGGRLQEDFPLTLPPGKRAKQ